MQEAGAANTCFCIAPFIYVLQGNYTAFYGIVKGHLAISGKIWRS